MKKFLLLLIMNVSLLSAYSYQISDSIKDLEEGKSITATAIVTAQSSRGLVFTDNAGSIFYYNPVINLSEFPIGTIVDIEGDVYIYDRGFELKNDASLQIVGAEDYTYPVPTEYDEDMITQTCLSEDLVNIEYIAVEGEISISGNYYNIIVDDSYYQASIYWPTDEFKNILTNGEDYRVSGYIMSVTSRRYLNLVATEIINISETETFVSDGIVYTGKNGECSIQGYTQDLAGDVIIPEIVSNGDSDFVVTGIEDYAFSNCASITNIKLPASIKTIGYEAFYYCFSLESIEMPGVESISGYAFYRCLSLQDVSIPSSTGYIGTGCFRWCTSLNGIIVNPENTLYASIDGVLFDKNISELKAYPGAKGGEYYIPSTVNSISSFAFDNCLNIEKVFIPAGVNMIGTAPFYYCTSLKAIEVDPLNSFYTSTDGVLYNYDMSQIIQCPGGRTEGFTLPSSVRLINYGCFAGCEQLSSIDLGNTVEVIDGYGIAYCKAIENITIPESVTFIGSYALRYNSSLKTLSLPHNLENIPVGLCSECENLSSVRIGDNTTSISSGAFYSCHSLESVEIPAFVSYIGVQSFDNCENLLNITSRNPVPPTISGNSFCTYEDAILYVDESAVQDYKNAAYWQNFRHIQSIGEAGIRETFTEQDHIIIYDLQGIERYNGNKDSLDRLPSGMYIINGKKVMIRK